MKAIVLCSGGLDSVVVAHAAAARCTSIELISFDYGQRHRTELEYAKRCSARLDAVHHLLDLPHLGGLLTGSSLTDSKVAVPEGHYAENSMRLTIVPNRNVIMLSVGIAIAVARQADAVAAAFHGGDHFVYPDCRPEFVEAFAAMESLALQGFAHVALDTPFLHWAKADIVREGARIGVPLEETWSCYAGGPQHCGRCGTCVERREAFHLAGVRDPTPYDDPEYWLQARRAYLAAQR